MTESLLRRVRPRVALAPLQRTEVPAALALCARDPVAYCMPAMHLEHAESTGRLAPGQLWSVRDRAPRSSDDGQRGGGKPLVGVVWAGANVIPAVPDAEPDLIEALADAMVARLPRPSALVGEAAVVLPVWERAERRWGPARDIRPEQWLMATSTPPRPLPPPSPGDRALAEARLEGVRPAELSDFDYLLPAAVHMFTAEVGYDPLEHGRRAYEDRLRRLIRLRRSFLQYGVADGERQVVFKAEAGVVGCGVAELQGVWVHPSLRRRGIGRRATAATVDLVQDSLAATVSLYVNDFNERAIRAYEAVGFRRVGTFATVMA